VDSQQVQDWINIGLIGNSLAMDWYAIRNDKPLPSQSLLQRTLGADLGGFPYSLPGGGQVSVGPSMGLTTGVILVGAVVLVGAFILLRN